MAFYKDKFVSDATNIPALLFKDEFLMLSEDKFHNYLLYLAIKPWYEGT
jgi:hypothetical protein